MGSMAVAGSFRDPSGRVFVRDGRLFRAIDAECHRVLRRLADEAVLEQWQARGLLVGTRFVSDRPLAEALAEENPGYPHFLEHDRVEPVTYPYEWSVSMLADAGLRTLELQEELLRRGLSLKDATAYNCQFVRGRPLFIDLSSIEQPRRLDVWTALGQFGQMFTYPLLLCRYHGWDLRSYFLASLGGRTAEQVSRSLGWLERWRPRTLLDVTLPLLLTRWTAARSNGQPLEPKASADCRPQILNLHRLRAKLTRLAGGYRPRGTWASYGHHCSYDATADNAKKQLVQQYLERQRPRRVLDVGCNTGDYSYLAAAAGAQVVAIDADHDAVELLYRRLRQQPAAITPLVVDLCNPSPAIGFRNCERDSFSQRIRADAILALALLHHLRVSGNLGFEAVRDLFCDLAESHLILEFVPPDDPMFRRLMTFRSDRLDDYTLERCRQVFGERFQLVEESPIPHSPRTLLFLRRR
jgi:SAM-dependent methyltransferase